MFQWGALSDLEIPAGDLAYALYTSTGYKIALLSRHRLDSLSTGVNVATEKYFFPDTSFTAMLLARPADNPPAVYPKSDLELLQAGRLGVSPELQRYECAGIAEHALQEHLHEFIRHPLVARGYI